MLASIASASGASAAGGGGRAILPNKLRSLTYTLADDGTCVVTWELRRPAAVLVSWMTGTDLATKQERTVNSGTTSTAIPGFTAPTYSVTYNVSVSILSGAASSASVEVLAKGSSYTTQTSETTCNALGMSRNGRYVVLANNNGIYLSSDFGATLVFKTAEKPAFLALLPSTTKYNALVSENGQFLVFYMVGNADCAYSYSTDGGSSFFHRTVVSAASASAFTLQSMFMSASGSRLFATGSHATDTSKGGIFLSRDFGASFISVITGVSTAMAGACSADGMVVAVASSSDSPSGFLSDNGGASFLQLNSGGGTYLTSSKGAFVNPQGSYVAFLTTTNDWWFTSYGSTAPENLPRLTKTAVTSPSSVVATQWDLSGATSTLGVAAMDRNNNLYFLSKTDKYLRAMAPNGLSSVSVGYNSTLFNEVVAGGGGDDYRLVASNDGRFVAAFDVLRSKLQVFQLWKETAPNVSASFTSASISSGGSATIAWTVPVSRKTRLRWWPPSSTALFPTTDYAAALSTSPSAIAGFLPNVGYVFTLYVLSADGKYIVSETKSSVLYVGGATVAASLSSFATQRRAHFDSSKSSKILTAGDVAVQADADSVEKLVDLTSNGNNMVSRALGTLNKSKYYSAGLGSAIRLPCVEIDNLGGANGFISLSSWSFVNEIDLYVVIRPMDTIRTSGSSVESLLFSKVVPGGAVANPFDIKLFTTMVGNGSSFTNYDYITTSTSLYSGTGAAPQAMLVNVTIKKVSSTSWTLTTRRNGVQRLPVTNVSNYLDSSTSLCYLGSRRDGMGSVKFQMGEFLVFPGTLTDNERMYLEGALARKWNLRGDSEWFSHPCYHAATSDALLA